MITNHEQEKSEYLTISHVGTIRSARPQAGEDRAAQLSTQVYHALHRLQVLLVQVVECQQAHLVTAVKKNKQKTTKKKRSEGKTQEGAGESEKTGSAPAGWIVQQRPHYEYDISDIYYQVGIRVENRSKQISTKYNRSSRKQSVEINYVRQLYF